jgi:hypothetical protein
MTLILRKSALTLEFGEQINMYNYIGTQMESNIDVNNIIHKILIVDVIYEPDKVNIVTEGRFGRCWNFIIMDSRIDGLYKLRCRNIQELFTFYNNQNYKIYT